MPVSYRSEKTVVTRLRVRGAGIDPVLARLRLASQLNTVGLRPAGLAPSALLVIKEIRDPLPGHLRLQQAGTRPPADWERALGSLLDQLLRRAERPALSLVDDSAEAVIFLDRAELLACLASDWCRGVALKRWWWRSLCDGPDIALSITRLWLEATEYVPAALNHLAKKREAVPFLRALKSTDSRRLLSGVMRSFALHKLEAALDAGREANDSPANFAAQEKRVGLAAQGAGGEFQPSAATGKPPWLRHVQETAEGGLEVDAQCLLGIGLMLHRAPSVVRSEWFARALSSWRRDFYAKSVGPASSSKGQTRADNFAQAEDSAESLWTDSTHASSSSPANFSESTGPGVEAMNGRTPATTEFSFHPAQDEEVAGENGSTPGSVAEVQGARWPAFSEGTFESSTVLPELEARELETAFGGLFYLVNLGLFLGLYGDFTSPAECAPSLPLWDFVALLGCELLGEKMESDPVWLLLAALAGRDEGESPGANFGAPDEWRMPADWLKPFALRCAWRWTTGGGRLRVIHERGFAVLDVPLKEDDAAAQLSLELQNYEGAAEFELRPAELPDEHEEVAPLRRWLDWLMPYVRVRVQQAVGLKSVEDLARVLCEHSARIVLTATHLDVFLSLAGLPVGIRLSGLDRDPGWVPAAGKFIAFHFD